MHLPSVGLGTMGIDDPEPVATALSLGYRHLDTARIYGNEAVVGDGLAEGLAASDVDRDEVTVATKLWVDDLGAADVGPTARESADLLGVETLDLLYVHRPRGAYDPVETLPALDRLVDEEVVREVGVSNFEVDQLDRAIDTLDAPLAAHQTELHPLFYRPELLEHAREHGYTVVAYSPLAGGRVSEIDAVVEVAEAHDATPEAVAIAWATAKEPVVTIPKASSEGHLRANLAAAEIELTPEEVAAIDAVEREEELFPE
ncbi:aldo/keto reductase [Halorubrum lacusprofundi]|jgi:2,5-diketo-D-gluconate reductase B|uniref:Aldo/keto reductase n=1 Tax=Halorubrum lacusprofundi (strain ATCC 49239 / DSM 5036 / JCM 8891 / ACAM 34) TaxID=416348 RepID=B9LPC2_HALLT|nr:aldo/keto reductase [Halorubrum lacusprofundi]ACM57210.1 aldo/keto reductase [Halorubrum lacusprofundi ATCC 49239]MCG1007265.1 aldo/keto reductase [Halorubrum lacusprofundi]